MNNTIKPNNKLIKCIKPIIVLLLFLIVTFISYFYLIIASMADQVISYSRFFLYTSPLYFLVIIISFIPKYKLSWAPISLLLFSISSLTIFRYSNNSPSFLNLPIILGISVLFDVIYFGLSIYEEN